jgi:tetratricopeptide (TPR) repeat protein
VPPARTEDNPGTNDSLAPLIVSNTMHWKTRAAFRMISNVPLRACGSKERGASLTDAWYYLSVRRAAPIAAVLLLAVSSAAADTIVLKNGRRIVAANVIEEGDRVSYETSAGKLSIPKSIVARIERDNFGSSSGSSSASEPLVSAPQVEPVRGYDDVVRLAIHDNLIDFGYISRLESDARSNSPVAVEKVAAAHHAAAQFLLSKGDINSAIDHYRQALSFAPDNMGLLLNLSVLYLRQSQFSNALDPLEHARRISPNSADVAKLMGWAYYGANKMDRAVEEWNRAERLQPDPEVEHALEKAQRDKAEEESYREGETAHFVLKYTGGATPDLARSILRALEDDFRDLESQLDYTPPEPIGVILYTDQAFADITRAPSWAGAINDGRIRVPVQGLSSVTSDLAHVLKHELTHSFVGQKSHGRAPTWVQEGVAQWMEGRRSNSAAAAIVEMAGQGQAPHLQQLEGSWLGLPSGAAAIAYAYALAAAESIIQAGGVSDISHLLDNIATAPSMESALRDTLHSDYADLDQQTITYLRNEYVH